MDPFSTVLVSVLLGPVHTLEYVSLFNVKVLEHVETHTVQVSAETRDRELYDVLQVRVKKKNHDVWLLVREGVRDTPHPLTTKNTPVRPGFECNIPIPDDVQRIIFGKKKTVLWQRTSAFGEERKPTET